jgi:hypothetical protein
MNRSLAVACGLLVLGGAISAGTAPAVAQAGPPQCAAFTTLSAEAKKKADAVQAAIKAKVDRSEICTLMTNFVASEGKVIKFLEDNKTWCGVPDDAIKMSKMNHEKSLKFREVACNSAAAGPAPKPPTLSDAIKMPSVDSATNTKTGRGTFDTLTGNPLSR